MNDFATSCKGPFKVGDLVLYDYANMGGWRGEGVGRVIRITRTQVIVTRLPQTTISEEITGSDFYRVSVADLSGDLSEESDTMIFRWAPRQEWYQTRSGSETQYYIKGKYIAGHLTSQTYG